MMRVARVRSRGHWAVDEASHAGAVSFRTLIDCAWDDEGERPLPVVVHQGEPSVEAFRGVIEFFVLHEGTDYDGRDAACYLLAPQP